VRIDRSCSLKDSAPCIDCMKVIKALNIKRIIFSTDSGGFMMVKPSEFVTTHISQGRRLLDNGIKVKQTIRYNFASAVR